MKISYSTRFFESVSKKAEAIRIAKKYIVIITAITITRETSAYNKKTDTRLIIAPALGNLVVPCLCASIFVT